MYTWSHWWLTVTIVFLIVVIDIRYCRRNASWFRSAMKQTDTYLSLPKFILIMYFI